MDSHVSVRPSLSSIDSCTKGYTKRQLGAGELESALPVGERSSRYRLETLAEASVDTAPHHRRIHSLNYHHGAVADTIGDVEVLHAHHRHTYLQLNFVSWKLRTVDALEVLGGEDG
jgi:hypothetical protein